MGKINDAKTTKKSLTVNHKLSRVKLKVDSSGLFSQPLVIDDKIYVQSRDGKVARVTLP